eukprot:COSAG02_NODE_1715_length_11211_cov_8.483801_10_plen_349_part_00
MVALTAGHSAMDDDPEQLHENTDLVLFNAYNSVFVVAQQGVVYPFELIKTRVQIAPAQGGSELAAMAEVARGVIADRGMVRGLFHGFPWLVGPMLFCEGLYYTTYVVMKKSMHGITERYVAPQHRETANCAIPFLAGGLAEACNTVVSVPTDILTQRLQIIPSHIEGSGPAVVRSIIAEQGLVGMFRGTTATIVSYVPFSAVCWATYEALKCLERKSVPPADALEARAGHTHADAASSWREHLIHACCGTGAATVATVVTNPIDVVKTRMQTHGAPSYLSVPQQSTAHSQFAIGQPHSLRQRSMWYHLRYQKHLMQYAETSFAAGHFCTSAPVVNTIGSDTGVRIPVC